MNCKTIHLFFSIIRDYLNRYKNDVATGEDFKKVLEEKTGRDFTAFFNQWFYGEGYPSITVNWKHELDTLYLYCFSYFLLNGNSGV